MATPPLSAFSEVVDLQRRWMPDWYAWLTELSRSTAPTTVSTLGAAGRVGRRGFVTDATATTFASAVVGGGANKVPVYDDGTSWRIG
jgi:hypothetical protein